MKQQIIIGVLFLTLFSCSNGKEKALLISENSSLIAQIDSLSLEIKSNEKTSATLFKAMTLLDSIDLGRKMLRITLENSDSQEDFIAHLTELKSYIAQTSLQISSLEKSLKNSKAAQNTYANTLKKLKEDFESQKNDIALLESRLETEASNNQRLVALNNIQSETILNQDEMIEAKMLELELLDQQISAMKSAFQISEADSYFTRGEAYSLAAQRTKLAPSKKKSTYKQALENYQKALDLGRTDAKEKIDLIAKKLH
ncbi:hypothetical protein ACV07N_08160 [Roseivirga echinicomitans]